MTTEERFSGLLPADGYLLELFAVGEGIGFEDALGLGTAGFGVAFAVPEPGAALWIVGALAAACRRRSLD